MKRNAFTLVELLTVIAIIGVLIGLLLPAVQEVREAARRASCQNNIRQIAVAVENYHASHNRYPLGWNAKDGHGQSGWSWLAYSLPFLEQDGVHDQIDFEVRVTDLTHRSLLDTRFEFLMCPSSGDRDVGSFSMDGITPPELDDEDAYAFPLVVARNHYVGNIGSLFTPTEILSGG